MQNVYLGLVLIVVFSKLAIGQQNHSTFRGKITGGPIYIPIVGASIKIYGTSFGTITDNQGEFKIDDLPTGRYKIKISAIGFAEFEIPEVLIDAGKEKVVELNLIEKINTLNEVIVHPLNTGTINPTSGRTFTVEESQRYAASFYDPARLVASYPGVTTTNDQANNISIRGNSPNAMAWRLEGVEIVNPNHLTNAGTYTDRPMQNGGGTIILSAQLLANSQFLTGAFSPEYGNSTAGLFDMRLRKGNNQKREHTIQIGLLGIDLATEGPFSKKSKASYLVNYRYSFTGLLGKLGVPLGDEAIAYQDLALNFNLPTKRIGNFTVFGMYGSSTNNFNAKDENLRLVAKDFNTVNFRSKMVAIGATHQFSIGQNTTIRSVFALSEKQNDRSELDYILKFSSYSGPFVDNLSNRKYSFTSSLNHYYSKNNNLKVGIYLTLINDQYQHANLSQENPAYVASFKSALIQPYFNWQSKIANSITLNTGLHFQYLAYNKTKSLEPRANITYKIDRKSDVTLAYSLQGQMQLVAAYGSASSPGFVAQNRNLGFSKAHHYVLNYKRIFGENLHFKAEAYLQKHFNVLATNTKSALSGMNLLDEYLLLVPLNNEGTATNKGVELSLEQYFQKKYYFLVSSTLYDAKYKGSDGVEINARFNGKYAASITSGKEWDWNKKSKNRIVGVNFRAISQGGYYVSPIDVESSRYFQKSLYYNSNDKIFTQKLPNYYRLDLRLSIKKHKPGYTRTLSLDLQNVTNHKNTAYYYFDWYKDKVVEQKQLGLIPVLNWRVEF
jgi:CarboxypepD_reg-like domain/TonB-dependent Receptor Plug Domain